MFIDYQLIGFDILIAFAYLVLFVKESDLMRKQIAMYLFSFVIFVVFSQLIFNKQFSAKQGLFSSGLDTAKYIIYLFSISFFVFTRKLSAFPVFHVKPLYSVSYFDLILSLPIAAFFLFYASTTGVRLSGEFLDHVGERSIWVDYMYVYCIVCLVVLRGSSSVVILVVLLAIAHFLAAERMRAFVYIMSLLIIFYNIQNKKYQSSIVLLSGFLLATIIGFARHVEGQLNDAYNVTHFGSVTISSLFLLDESLSFTALQQTKFFIGSIVANLVPSSFLSEEYNIRLFLVNAQDIPGGGWLPVWSFVIGGFIGVFALATVIAIFYRWMMNTGTVSSKYDLAKYTMLVIFLATLPRWFMYTPYQILKMPLYGYIGTFLLVSFIEVFSKRKSFG